MKKRILLILFFFLLGAIIIYLVTSPKIEKWTYDLLPNDYAIKKTSDVEVVLGKYINGLFEIEKDNRQIGVEDYIAEFNYGKNYISLKCLESVKEGVKVKFYIVDTSKEYVYGPYQDEETYNKVAEKIVEEELGDWIKTITRPKGAIDK